MKKAKKEDIDNEEIVVGKITYKIKTAKLFIVIAIFDGIFLGLACLFTLITFPFLSLVALIFSLAMFIYANNLRKAIKEEIKWYERKKT